MQGKLSCGRPGASANRISSPSKDQQRDWRDRRTCTHAQPYAAGFLRLISSSLVVEPPADGEERGKHAFKGRTKKKKTESGGRNRKL